MAFPDVSITFHDIDSDNDGNDSLFLKLPYSRPNPDDYFSFWTFHESSQRAAPLLCRVSSAEAVAGIMAGNYRENRDLLKFSQRMIEPELFSTLGPELVSQLQKYALAHSSSALRKVIFIEPKSPSSTGNDQPFRRDFPKDDPAKYIEPKTLPGWSLSIYMASKFQSWPGIAELYIFPPGPFYIPTLQENSIRFGFPIPTGGKKDYNVLTDVPGAHYSLRLQCARELQAQWPRLKNIDPQTPGLELVLNNFVVPEIVFMASSASEMLDREHFVDFIFRGFEHNGEEPTWALEVKKLVSHHIPFHFRKRKLIFVASN